MNNKVKLFSLILVALACYLIADPLRSDPASFISFQQFKREFNKTYSSPAEETYRNIVFNVNEKKIKLHNADPKQSFKLGVTQFADLTQEEFIKTYLGANYQLKNTKSLNTIPNIQSIQTQKPNNLRSKSAVIDWAAKGNVTPVRNQGMCGSCWAFSASGAVQSSYSIFRGDNTYLSPQQLVDCSSSYGNNGCNGGKMDAALNYIKDHGLSTQKQYPYIGRQQGCRKDFGNYRISSVGSVSQCTSLYNAIQQRPISVGVDAATWALYKEGILTICGHNINHGALLVGVADNYWKIKNSWGTSWGENGYIRIARGNTCGVCGTAFYPLL